MSFIEKFFTGVTTGGLMVSVAKIGQGLLKALLICGGGDVTRGKPIYWLGKVVNCGKSGTVLLFLPSLADCVIKHRSWMWGRICTYCVEASGLGMRLVYRWGRIYKFNPNVGS